MDAPPANFLNDIPTDSKTPTLDVVLRGFLASALDLPLEEIQWHRSWLAHGGDSLTAITFVGSCYEIGVDVEIADLLGRATLSEIIDRLLQLNQSTQSESEPEDGPEPCMPLSREQVPPTLHGSLELIQGLSPCSTMQENFLAVQASNPEAYQLHLSLQLSTADGVMDLPVERVRSAYAAVVARHPALRTTFAESASRPGRFDQIVWESIELPVTCLALNNAEISPARDEDSQIPHHLILAQVSPNAVLLKLSISHTIVDGLSAEVLLRDLCRALTNTLPVTEPMKRVDYYNAQLPSSSEDAIAYWSKYTESAQATFLGNTASKTRPTGYYTVSKDISLPSGLIGDFSEDSHATLVNAAQVAWGLVLRSYTGSDRVSCSLTTSGRQRHVAGLHNAVGNFVNTLPFRCNFDETPIVADALRRAQDEFLESLPYQTADLTGSNSTSGVSVFQLGDSIISFHRAPSQSYLTKSGFAISDISWAAPSDYNFSLGVNISRDSLALQFDVWESLITRKDSDKLLCLFRDALYWILQYPEKPISAFIGIVAEDQEHVLARNRNVPSASSQCIHDLVLHTISAQPRAPAISSWDGTMTYEELQISAYKLAYHLRKLGVRIETKIGLCMDKSCLVPIVMLAVLLSGGTVVPLGVQYPLDRVRTIVADAKIEVLFVDARQKQRLEGAVQELLLLDPTFLDCLPEFSTALPLTTTPGNAAWVVYTSGSTGLRLGFTPSTRTLQFADYTFDPSIQDIFTTLTFGGCICIPSASDRVDNLAGFMHAHQVNFACITSTVAATIDPSSVPSLQTIVLGGEPVAQPDVDRWLPTDTKVFNAYGPAECSIHSSANGPLTDGSECAIVGYPIASNFWVANPSSNGQQLVPIGAPGELLIEGPILGREYLHNAITTKQAFIADPDFITALGLKPGRRLYRTGDLVKQNSNGSYTHLGRIDSQRKINGMRVEVGEIETRISQSLLGIRHVCVDLLKSRTISGTSTLVAAIEMDTSDHSSVNNDPVGTLMELNEELKECLADLYAMLLDLLPLHMVPSHYIPVTRLPVNASYKLDRRATRTILENLTDADFHKFRRSASEGAITTETERKLQMLWSEVLGIPEEQIGSRAHYFQLGADSVVAMRMVALARRRNIPLSVAQIVEHPRLSELATAVDRHDSVRQQVASADPQPFELCEALTSSGTDQRQDLLHGLAQQCGVGVAEIEDVYPCTPIQESLMAMTSENPETYVAQQTFRLTNLVNVTQLQEAWTALGHKLAILRTRIAYSRDLGSVQVVTRTMERLAEAASLEHFLEADSAKSFSPGMPLIRIAFVKDTEDADSSSASSYLVLTCHHSAYDGWAMMRMFTMLAQLYARQTCDPAVPVPRFIRHIVQKNLSPTGRSECEVYWKEQLQGAPMIKFPPIPDSKHRTFADGKVTRRFEGVELDSNGSRVSPAVLIQAAWSVVVSSRTGSQDTTLAMVLSGRDAPIFGIEDVVAPTVATVPVRVTLDPSQRITDFLSSIEDQNKSMTPYAHFGLQNIRRAVGHEYEIDPGHLFVVQVDMPQEVFLPAHSIGMERTTTETRNFEGYPLVVECTLSPNGRTVDVEMRHDTRVLSTAHAVALLHQLEHVLTQLNQYNVPHAALATSQQNACLQSIEVLSPFEKEILLERNSFVPAAMQNLVHASIEHHILERPKAPAICTKHRTLTFAELGSAANRLAGQLVALGVGPEVPVAFCMEKSEFAVIAMLAIVLAGGAGVPLGVQYPDSRIDVILADANVRTVLVDDGQAKRFACKVSHTITVNDASIKALRPRKFRPSTHPSNIAWVIYTSGSTGTPKGVVLEHRSLSTSIAAQITRYGLTASTRTFQFSAFTFDISIADVFTTLSVGGCVCVPSESDRVNRLAPAINELRATLATLTPTVLSLLDPDLVAHTLQKIVLAGEAVKPAVIARWVGRATLFNGYGPSESSIYSAINGPIRSADEAPIIGSPVSNVLWVTVQDDPDNLVPIGTVGELLVEGPLLAREYLHDPIKTASSFITDPKFLGRLGLGPGRRMYRTGDLVSQSLQDGRLTYVGRRATMLKLRGQRVDVGDIETHILRLHQGLQHTCVSLVSVSGAREQMLIAAVELSDQNDLCVRCEEDSTSDQEKVQLSEAIHLPSGSLRSVFESMRSDLCRVLPLYMVPTHFVPMTIPINGSGKLDRAATQRTLETLNLHQLKTFMPDMARKDDDATMTVPEEQLRSLWAEVLGLGPEDIKSKSDDFFQFGGDSVAAMRLVQAVEHARIPLKLGVVDVLQNPRLGDMAQAASSAAASVKAVIDRDPGPFELWSDYIGMEVQEMNANLASLARQCEDLAGPSDIVDVFPATPLQEGMMVITARQSSAYRVQQVFRVSKDVALPRLQQAWKRLASEVPMLRSRIVHTAQGAMNIVTARSQPWVFATNLRAYLVEDRSKAFTYGTPLLRTALVEEGSHMYLVWTAHHAAYDGWSLVKTLSMLASIYHDEAAKIEVAPMSRFVKSLDQVKKDDMVAFWSSQYEKVDLTRFPPLPDPTYQPKALSAVQRRIHSTSHNVLKGTLLRAAWAITVATFTGSKDAIVNISLSGRDASIPGIQDIVGPTICTVPLPTRIHKDQPVGEFLRLAEQQVKDMSMYAHAGLQEIRKAVPALGPGWDADHLFIIQPAPTTADSLSLEDIGLELDTGMMEPTDFGGYALTVDCTVGANSIDVDMRFDSNVLSPPNAATVLSQFEHYVRQLHDAKPTTRLADLTSITSDHAQIIKSWNERIPPTMVTCIHEQILASASRRPNAQAVCAWDGTYTYAGLCEVSQRLATHLIDEFGVGPEVKIGFSMAKSRNAVVAILAILLAGAVVVPFGGQQPLARISRILKDSNISIVLTDSTQAERLVKLEDTSPVLVAMNTSWLEALPTCTAHVCQTVKPDNAAWIVYTSGSTGVPKGIVLEHKALCSSFRAHGSKVGFSPDTRALQFSSFTFDNSIEEVLSVLIHGGCICMPSEDQRINDPAQAIRHLNANLINTTPTVASLLTPSEVPMLQTVLLGGEGLTPSVVERWSGHADIFNTYGPAECSVDVACSGPIQRPSEASTIGHALGVNFWVAEPEDHNRLVPIGAPGELLVEGPHLGREYLNDVQKTDDAFVWDPAFVKQLGISNQARRMYKTGDLVTQNLDGSLVHLGRIDSQLKIAGQRVDPGEIEGNIVRLQGKVNVACVELIRVKDLPKPVLVAAVAVGNVGREETSATETLRPVTLRQPTPSLIALCADLQEKLLMVVPRYMVPHFVPMTSLPQNASNKLDRRATRAILESLSHREITALQTTPENDSGELSLLEERLCLLWVQVLGCPPNIGRQSDFFQLGGDSVMAMRLVAAARSTELHFGVADVIEHPNLGDLAQHIAAAAADGAMSMQVDLAPFELWPGYLDASTTEQSAWLSNIAQRCNIMVEDIEDVYPATPLQESLMAMTAQRPGALVAQNVFRCKKGLDVDRLRSAWDSLVLSLPILRTRIVFHTAQSGTVQVVQRAGLNWHESNDLSTYLEQDKDTEFEFGTLLHRLAIVNTADEETYFVWTQHHSGYDGYQAALIFDLLTKLYLKQEPCGPAQPPVTRFIKYLRDKDEEDTADYWRKQLSDANSVRFPSLPHPWYRPFANKLLERWISHDGSNRHRLTGRVTPLLRAAWAITVAAYTNSTEATSTLAVSGRDIPVREIGNMAFPTLTAVPFRVRLERDDQFVSQLLDDIHRQDEGMKPYIHSGLQQIRAAVPELGADYDPGHLFIVQPSMEEDDDGSQNQIGLEELPTDAAGFGGDALMIQCVVHADSTVKLDLRFDEKLLPVPVAENLLSQFEYSVRLLESHSQSRLADLPLLRPTDIATIKRWNSPVIEAEPVRRCVHELVQDMAARQPSASAVVSWDGELSYAELTRAACTLAHLLRRWDVGPEVTVGICMGKSIWAVVSMFAVLLAGGVVVTLDFQHSKGRIGTIVESAGLHVVLVDKLRFEQLPDLPRPIVVDATSIAHLPPASKPPASNVTPDSAAWIIYTSGSSGVPKAVVLEHKALCSGMLGHGAVFGHDVHTRALQVASNSFCQVIEDVFTTLVFGGTVCVPSDAERLDLYKELPTAMCRMNVNFLQITPTVASILDPKQVPSVKTIGFGGERVRPEVVERWSKHARMISGYGQSECSIESVMGDLKPGDNSARIGLPIANCAAWVVHPKDYNRLVPIGAPGELVIQGPILARGYRGTRMENQAFVSSPAFLQSIGFAPGVSDRMYRTGDLVQQALDGSLIYLGRIDDQIQVKGQRVEPGEVEHHISQLDHGVWQVLVDLITPHGATGSSDAVLVAAIHFKGESGGTIARHMNTDKTPPFLCAPNPQVNARMHRIQNALLKKLPQYMVPSYMVPMAHELPQNASNKTDRRATRSLLGHLTRDHFFAYKAMKQDITRSLTATEQSLRRAYAEVLNCIESEVGLDDHFIQLGGDSVAAMRVAAVCRKQGTNVSVQDLLLSRSIIALASLVDQRAREKDTESSETLDTSLAVTDVQETILNYHLARPDIGRTWFTLDATGPLIDDTLANACRKLLASFEILHTGFIKKIEGWERLVLPPSAAKVSTHDTDVSIEEWTATHMKKQVSKAVVEGQPLVDVAICSSNQHGGQHRILLNMSHAVWDGVCISNIWASLQDLCNGKPAKEAASFSQYVAEVEKRRTPEATAYWKGLLHDSTLTSLTPQGSQKIFRADMKGPKTIALDARLPSSITCANLVRAAWSLVLARSAHTPDVVFADGVSGRSGVSASVADAIGCCSTPIPVRVRLDPSWTREGLLRLLQDQQLQSMPYETFGFGKIAKLCTDWPSDEAAPSFLNHVPLQHKGFPLQLGDKTYTVLQPPQEEKNWTFSETRITWQQVGDAVEFVLVYAADRLSEQMAEQMYDDFALVIRGLLESPSESIRGLLEGS